MTPQSVCRWRREAQHRQPPPRRRTPGRPWRLSSAHHHRLLLALKRGAYAYGYAEDYWTLDRVAPLIWDLFGIRYHASRVWYVLPRLGWSCQKPQRRSLARDEKAIAHWKHYGWPHIKKVEQLSAPLVFPDETGFSLGSPLKRTWAPRAQTPVIRINLAHNERLNLIGALCVTPAQRQIKLHLQSHRHSSSRDEVLSFLTHLSHQVKEPSVRVWHKHPMHHRRKVKDWLAHHPRIHVYEFPTSAPELNPTEFVWTQTSEYTASTAPHQRTELRTNVFAGVARTRRSQSRLWACIFASDLPWER